MESVLGALAFWAGLNFGALALAGVAGLVVGVMATGIRRERPDLALVAGAVGFFAVFGYRTAQSTSGWVFLRSEDRTLAVGAAIAVGIATLAVVMVGLALRSNTRASITIGVLGMVCIGLSVPIADGLIPAHRAVEPATAQSAAPLTYPGVAVWSSETEGFAAWFPTEPTRIEATALQGSGYAFHSVFAFADGGATANVTVSPLSFALDSASQHVFLASAHRIFLQSIGAMVDSSRFRWTALANGVPVLQYEALFEFQGVSMIGKGHWVMDRKRAIRVSVAYPRALSQSSASVADYFPNTFMLLGNRTSSRITP